MCHFCWAYPGEQAERVVGKEDVAPVPAEHEVVGEEEFAPVQEHEVVDREEVAHVLAEQRFGYEQVRNCSMNRSLSNWRRMVTEFFLREIKLELSWFAVSWGRMANEFFLREINAHRCMMFNLSLGSASAMRRLRQEAGDLEEAPLPEQVVGDEEVAEQPEHEVDGDVGASPRTLRKNLTGMPCIGNGASSNTQLHPTPAAHPSHTSRWEGCNLYLDLSQTRALDAMGLPDDGSDLSESFLDARRAAMRDNLSDSFRDARRLA